MFEQSKILYARSRSTADMLEHRLDEALFGPSILEAMDPKVLERHEWISADPDLLGTVAYTNSKKQFWNALKAISRELYNQGLVTVINHRDDPAYAGFIDDLMRTARKEARMYAQEVGAIAPRRSMAASRKPTMVGPAPGKGPKTFARQTPLQARQAAGKPDFLGWTDDEKDEYYRKRREARAKKPRRKFVGDDVYIAVNKITGRKMPLKIDGKLVYTQADAHAALADMSMEDPELDIDEWEVKAVDNSKSIEALKNIRGMRNRLKSYNPEGDWTMAELINTLKPWIRHLAWKYVSGKNSIDDLMQHGAIGVINAVRTDKADAPFAHHAWRHIQGEIRRAALTGGVIKGSEWEDPEEKAARKKMGVAGPGTFRSKGPVVGYDVYFYDEDGTVKMKHFPSEVEKMKGSARRSDDPAYKAARDMAKQVRASGRVAAVRDRRSNMASTAAKIRGAGGGETELGSTLKGTSVRGPAKITMTKDTAEKLMSMADLSDREREVVEKMFGLDVPAATVTGPSFRSEKAFGPGEEEPEERKPGEQAGITDPYPEAKKAMRGKGQLRRTNAGKGVVLTDPRSKIKHEVPLVARGPTDVAQAIGVGRQRAGQLAGRAMTKLKKAADKLARQEREKRRAARASGLRLDDVHGIDARLAVNGLLKMRDAAMEVLSEGVGDVVLELLEAAMRRALLEGVDSGVVSEAFSRVA